jgi:hypothetical protein
MTFADQIAADLTAVFFNTDEFAETITFKGVTIPAIVTRQKKINNVGTYKITAWIEVKVSDVPAPKYRDVVVIGADTFYVYQDDDVTPEKDDSGLTWIIPLIRDERPL